MQPNYTPQELENKWYSFWEDNGYFKPKPSKKEAFTIVIPPPNVTGALHMGHALNNTIQDALIRFKRLQGFEVLWQPGTDHAGIATQSVVERKLAKQGINPKANRENFIGHVWKWKEEYGNRIINQLKKLGSSCDWSRTRFTMDKSLSDAVQKVFVEYYQQGLIYYGHRLINWCPKLQTALADEEVETKDTQGHFWSIRYPLSSNPKQHIIVATTRPETLFGDSAIAVHPNDERYKHLIGTKVIIPIINREIPIIADEHANPEKGTGAVKITPAHDFDDFQVGQRHNLEQITVISPNGSMNEHAGKYQGLYRFKCRQQLIKDLQQLNLLESVENKVIPIPYCYRSGDVIEPRLMGQWFVKMKPLAKKAIASVKGKRTQFFPERYSKTYFAWLEQYRDWCISRQIWWGHQIPVWYVISETQGTRNEKTPYIVALNAEDALQEAQTKYGESAQLIQDEDVLDTWFSSALWPFSTLGWPEQTEDLKRFYPTDVLVTARDIIYFWVARMMFSGLHFLKQEPFHSVYIHGTVLDEKGQRMSKSKGNGIDPLDMIEQYGADAVRFSLLILTSQGQDIKLSESKFEMGRNFANKLWNAVRFVLPHLKQNTNSTLIYQELDTTEKWILAKLQALIAKVTQSLENYRFSEACFSIYHFVWDDFCSSYLEIKKSVILSKTDSLEKSRAIQVFQEVLEKVIVLLHPFMPFITEEIYSLLNTATNYQPLIVANFPTLNLSYQNQPLITKFDTSLDMVKAVRSIRGQYSVSPSKPLKVFIYLDNNTLNSEQKIVLNNLEKIESLDILTTQKAPEFSASAIFQGGTVYVMLEGILDKQAEITKINHELKHTQKFINSLEKKLSNSHFVDKAPAEVVTKEQLKLKTQQQSFSKLQEALKQLER